jgi:hypothetical protein
MDQDKDAIDQPAEGFIVMPRRGLRASSLALTLFIGFGTPGATRAAAHGSSAILNGDAGVLPGIGSFSSIARQTFVVSPVGSYVYVLTRHTLAPWLWRDKNTGFVFAMNARITRNFTDALDVTTSYDLYQSI